MAQHHNIPEQGVGVASIVLTALLSIWASIAMEVTHGIITLFFGLATCVGVFFLNRYLKKRFP